MAYLLTAQRRTEKQVLAGAMDGRVMAQSTAQFLAAF